MTAGPFTRTVAVDRRELLDPLDPAEVETFVRVLLRLFLKQLTNKTSANFRAALQAKVVDLTVTG